MDTDVLEEHAISIFTKDMIFLSRSWKLLIQSLKERKKFLSKDNSVTSS
jgi:hypothetical protein